MEEKRECLSSLNVQLIMLNTLAPENTFQGPNGEANAYLLPLLGVSDTVYQVYHHRMRFMT
jgi:hypothetical protein